MSLEERTASRRFIQAMGPMVKDENKMQQVILFINSIRTNQEELPKMSYEELEKCIPLDVAFQRLREDIRKSYEA